VSELLVIITGRITACSRILHMLLLLLLPLSGAFITVEQLRRVTRRPAVLTTRHRFSRVCRLRLSDVIVLCALAQTANVTRSRAIQRQAITCM